MRTATMHPKVTSWMKQMLPTEALEINEGNMEPFVVVAAVVLAVLCFA